MKYVSVLASLMLTFTLLNACSGPPSQKAPLETAGSTGDGDAVVLTVGDVGGGEAAKEQTGETGDWIIYRLEKEPSTLNAVLDTADAYTIQVNRYMVETLIDRDPETLEWVPVLAESWEISGDKLTYTYHMDPDARFSDGEPVTTADVKFTIDAIQNPENQTADLRTYTRDLERVEVVDDYTIKFHVSKPYFKHLEVFGTVPVYPEHIYGEGNFNKHPANRAPVGSGPYVFDEWDTNQQIVLKRNPDWWRKDEAADEAFVERLVYKIISDDDPAFQVVEKGELDVAPVQPEQWVHRVMDPEFGERYHRAKYWAPDGYYGAYSYIVWNMRKPQFQEKEVRQALTMLLNRDLILEEIYYGLGKVVSGSMPWQSPSYDESIEPWPFDPARAKAQLDETGWVDSDGDGIRDKDGAKLQFEFLLVTGRRESEQLATIFKEELDRAGIQMNIRPVEWVSLIESLTNRDFDATTLSWAIPPDSDPFQLWHSSAVDAGSNYPGIAMDELDRFIEEARLEFDRDKRGEIHKEVHAILHEQQPYTFLWNRNELVVISNRFQNVKVYPLGLHYVEWWAPASMQMY